MDIPLIHTVIGHVFREELTHAVVLWAQCVETMGETRAQALVRDYFRHFGSSQPLGVHKAARIMQDITGVDLWVTDF